VSEIPHHMLAAREQIARRFISGSGIEIGALARPLTTAPGTVVRYVDRLPLEMLRRHYPELCTSDIIPPDIIDDGEELSALQDGSLDFVIANHMLEHCENPLGAVRNHLRTLRRGGILYYAVPEKTQSFDAQRPTTPFSHLVDDDRCGPQQSRFRHFREWATLINRISGTEEIGVQVRELMEMNYSIHFHVWDEKGFRDFVRKAYRYLDRKFRVEHLVRNDTEMIAVLRKR